MPNVLVTAFEPYDRWRSNASWLALVALTHDLPPSPQLTTRRYPVDFALLPERLRQDLEGNYDYVLHLGQAPGSARIRLEAVGLNIACTGEDADRPLVPDGPLAYRSRLPLGDWAVKLRAAGVPAEVSYHAGTYLCNAALYLTHYFSERMGLRTQAAFIHVPLDPSQVIDEPGEMATLPAALSAAAIRRILEELV